MCEIVGFHLDIVIMWDSSGRLGTMLKWLITLHTDTQAVTVPPGTGKE